MTKSPTPRKILNLTTLQALNKLTAAQNMLLQLRVMNTSDLTFQYMLYSKEFLSNLDNVASRLLALEFESGIQLTPEEVSEYNGYLKDMAEYWNG